MKIFGPKGWRSLAAVMLFPFLQGCIDNDYDLSDIETTVQFKVEDLVIPVNIDKVTLETIFDIDDDSRIQVISGQYVMTETGSFDDADEIMISPIHIPAQPIAPVRESLPAVNGASFPMLSVVSDFTYRHDNVDESIQDIDHITTLLTLGMEINFDHTTGTVARLKVDDFRLQLPAGLTGEPSQGEYDPTTGVVSLGDVTLDGTVMHFTMPVSAIDMDMAGATFDKATHSFVFSSSIGIAGGLVHVLELHSGAVAAQLGLNIDFALSEFQVLTFSGRLNYHISGLEIDPIEINDLPDMLDQPETDISLVNPQIYMAVNNPLENYRLYARSGLTIVPSRGDVSGDEYTLDDGMFDIGKGTSREGQYYYCLSPESPQNPVAGFTDPVHIPFSSLSEVLSGEGLPSRLEVRFDNPQIPSLPVEDLPIGVDLGKVGGRYELYAPLALSAGSRIVYVKTEDGWNDEDIDAITIGSLVVTAKVKSTLPVGVTLSGFPIDINGKQVAEQDEIQVPAGADGQEITFAFDGPITHLDGITFKAVCVGSDENPLRPDQTIEITGLRAKVSGNYTKEL